MSENNNIKTALPKLRFPEFVNHEEWIQMQLSAVSNVNMGQSPSSDSYNSACEGLPLVQGNADIVDRRTKPARHTNSPKKIACKGDLIMTVRAPVGTISIAETDVCIGRGVCSISAKSNTSQIFIYQYLINLENKWDNIAQGGIFASINGEDVKKLQVFFPTNYQEQTKIAECLSSLDDAISGVSDKIEALKEYKKGLMQQLFPAEGKTTPAFRFPEFKSNKPWDMDSHFSKYIKLYRGSSPRPIKQYLTNDDNGINWIKIGDTKNAVNYTIDCVEEKITPAGSLKSRYVNIGELILANSMSFGKTYQLNVEGCIYDGWFVLREYEAFFDKQFLLQLLNSDYMQCQYKRLSAGGIVQNISSDIVYQTIVPWTSIKEQQKIADFLISIDDLISSSIDRKEKLEIHKKGLMQQLFPTLNE